MSKSQNIIPIAGASTPLVPLEGVLFDKDGTLFDFRGSWGLWAAGFLADLAQTPEHGARLAQAIGYLPETKDFRPDSRVIAGTAADLCEILLPLLPGRDAPWLKEVIDTATSQVEMVPAVPLIPLFDQLRGMGLKLGVATNDSEAPARRHLASHGLIDYMDYIAGYDSGFGAKPAAGMCLGFAASLGLDPARIAMVGDSLHDLHAGRAAGMQTIAVLTGIATAEDLAPFADVVLHDIGDIPAWLAGNRA